MLIQPFHTSHGNGTRKCITAFIRKALAFEIALVMLEFGWKFVSVHRFLFCITQNYSGYNAATVVSIPFWSSGSPQTSPPAAILYSGSFWPVLPCCPSFYLFSTSVISLHRINLIKRRISALMWWDVMSWQLHAAIVCRKLQLSCGYFHFVFRLHLRNALRSFPSAE